MIDEFRPTFAGELSGVGEALGLTARAEQPGYAISDLLDEPRRNLLLAPFVRRYGDADYKAVVSLWSQWYFAVLVPPLVIIELMHDRLLPVDLEQLRLHLDDSGNPSRVDLPDSGQTRTPRNCFDRFAPLVFQHLTPLCNTLAACSGLSPRVLWSNAAVRVAWAVDVVERHALGGREAAQPGRELLGARQWPNGCANPLFEPVRFAVPGDEQSACTRRICCLRYRIEGIDYCPSCPLPHKGRLAKG